jgi:putative SOS response-associated peptidase YedK
MRGKAMCGRFVGFRSLDELKKIFPIDKTAFKDIGPNYNVSPTQEILAIINKEGQNWLEKLHWGLVPFWSKDTSIGNRMINARLETIAEKPSFRNAFKTRRCLIIADGFYEWKGEKGRKQPMFITLPEGKPFAFAGLWETWTKSKDAKSVYKSCTIITTEACESLRSIHHRMPVILNPDMYESWLDSQNAEKTQLLQILKDGMVTELVSHPVSKRVNSARYNDPTCIDPIFES